MGCIQKIGQKEKKRKFKLIPGSLAQKTTKKGLNTKIRL